MTVLGVILEIKLQTFSDFQGFKLFQKVHEGNSNYTHLEPNVSLKQKCKPLPFSLA